MHQELQEDTGDHECPQPNDNIGEEVEAEDFKSILSEREKGLLGYQVHLWQQLDRKVPGGENDGADEYPRWARAAD